MQKKKKIKRKNLLMMERTLKNLRFQQFKNRKMTRINLKKAHLKYRNQNSRQKIVVVVDVVHSLILIKDAVLSTRKDVIPKLNLIQVKKDLHHSKLHQLAQHHVFSIIKKINNVLRVKQLTFR